MEKIKDIYCIGRNYVEHIHELGNEIPSDPVVFTKPASSIVEANGASIELPSARGDIHYEAELVVKMARDYDINLTVDQMISEMTIGLDLTLRDVQSRLKEKGHPWLLAKGFKHSAVLGEFISFVGENKCRQALFSLEINDKQVQAGDINKMIFPLASQIHYLGRNFNLKKGDIIFTGTPEGVGALHENDQLTLKWDGKTLGKASISFK